MTITEAAIQPTIDNWANTNDILSHIHADAQIITRAGEVYVSKRIEEVLRPSIDERTNDAHKAAEIIALVVLNMTEEESIQVGAIDHRARTSCWFDVKIGVGPECNIEQPVEGEFLTNAERVPASEIVIVAPRHILEKFASKNLGPRHEEKGFNDQVTYDKKGSVYCLRIQVTPRR